MINKPMKNCFLGPLLFIMMMFACAHASQQPVQCLVTVLKNPLWNNESVTVDILDNQTKTSIQTVILPAATAKTPSVNTVTASIDCYKYSQIQMQASYTPVVWSTDAGKTYLSKDTYDFYNQLIQAEKLNTTALEITLTFPDDFVGVPELVN